MCEKAWTRSKRPLLIKYDFEWKADAGTPGYYSFPQSLGRRAGTWCWYGLSICYSNFERETVTERERKREREREREHRRNIHRRGAASTEVRTKDWLELGQLATTQSVISFFLKPACTSPLSLCPFTPLASRKQKPIQQTHPDGALAVPRCALGIPRVL